MRYTGFAIFLIAIIGFSGITVSAQESELRVVDEVVAQVNEGVITLSRIKREMNDAIEVTVQENGKSREQARTEIEGRQGELIANLINEELLLQKGKEIGLESEVEAQINQRFLEIMKQQNIKSLEVLYQEMERTGVDQQTIRSLWRKQLMRDLVLQREVDSRIYFSLNAKEVKAYYEANKAKFTKPETVSISEIFLNFAGRDEAAVRERAKQLIAQARGGADFGKLAAENSDRPDARETLGKIGTISSRELDKTFAEPLKKLKVGEISDAIEIPEGIEILRLDARTEASRESFYDEAEVRKTMTYERMPEERKKFMSKLRQDAYIKINDNYRPVVSPILFADDRKAEVKKTENRKN